MTEREQRQMDAHYLAAKALPKGTEARAKHMRQAHSIQKNAELLALAKRQGI